MAVPTYIGAGATYGTTGAAHPAWPAHEAGDIGILLVETAGGQPASLSTSGGFLEVGNSPQFTGVADEGTRLSVWWCRATSNAMPTPTISDAGDHIAAVILVFRGCASTGNPINASAGGVKAGASTSCVIPGLTTTVAECLVLLNVSRETGGSTGTITGWVSNDLTNLTARANVWTTSGNDGGIGVATGEKAVAGVVGSSQAVMSVSSRNAYLTIALAPGQPSVNGTASATLAVVLAQAQGGGDGLIWNDATQTWDDIQGTWDQPGIVGECDAQLQIYLAHASEIGGVTWDESTGTWDETGGTWDDPEVPNQDWPTGPGSGLLLPAFVQSAGSPIGSGSAAASLLSLVAVAAAIQTVSGDGAAELAPLTGEAEAGAPITGIGDAQLGELAAAASGIQNVSGSADALVYPIIPLVAGSPVISGTIASSRLAATASAFGPQDVYGTITASLRPMQAVAASEGVVGNGFPSHAAISALAEGSGVISGSGGGVLASVQAQGLSTPYIVGSAAGVLLRQTVSTQTVLPIVGSGAATFEELVPEFVASWANFPLEGFGESELPGVTTALAYGFSGDFPFDLTGAYIVPNDKQAYIVRSRGARRVA